MIKELLNHHLIDIEGLFLFRYKSLEINEIQAMIILMTLRLEKEQSVYITPTLLSKYMQLDEKTLDKEITILMNKQLLTLNNNSLSSLPLMTAILKQTGSTQEVKEDSLKKVNLVNAFEKEFGRSLTPIEIEILKEWKQCQYQDDMILEALKEATLSSVHSMRYIEKILVDWAKHGMKKSGREKVDLAQKTVELVEYDWWNE